MKLLAGSSRVLTRKVVLLAFAFVMVLATTGCDSTKSDWRNAQGTNTVDAYQQFLARHPQAAQAAEAKSAIENLEWEVAKRQNSIEAYAGYLDKYSDGRFAGEARRLSEDLEWSATKAKNSPTAYLAYFRTHRDSARLLVGRGTVRSAIAYPMDGGQPVLWIEVNGARVDMSPEEAGKLGIITYKNGIIETKSGSMRVTIIRDKASGKILTIDATGKS